MSAGASSSRTYILISSDNVRVDVPFIVIKESKTLSEMKAIVEKKNEPIPLPDISSETLYRIKAFCQKFTNEPAYVIPENYVPDPSPWLEALGEIEGDDLVEFLQAANFLNMPRAIDAGLLKIQSFMTGQSIENIRTILNLPADLSSEEEKELGERFIWNDPSDD